MRRQQWRFYYWLLIGAGCWQSCLFLPQKSPVSHERPIQALDFEYLTLHATISYRQEGQSQRSAQVRLRLQKDQCIWWSVLGPLGIEILRGMATPTGVTLLNRTQKTYHIYDYATLQSLWPGPWNYALIQALLLGELARAHKPREVIQSNAQEIVIQQQIGAWMLNHLVNRDLGKLERLVAKGPRGTFIADYHQFKAYQEGLLFKKAAFNWYYGTTTTSPAMTVKLAGLRPRWSQKPLRFPFVIPANYEKR